MRIVTWRFIPELLMKTFFPKDNPGQEAGDKRFQLITIILTGLVSLAVGVGTTFAIDFFKGRTAKLEFEIVSSSSFVGPTQKFAFVTVNVTNSGSRELESVSAEIDWKGGDLVEAKHEGFPANGLKEKKTNSSLQVELPFLNPGESGKIFVLINLTSEVFSKPSVTLRSKGVTGVERTYDNKTRTSSWMSLLPLLSVLVVFFFGQKWFGRFTNTKSHADDQRDVSAFVLDLFGFYDLAAEVRTLTRKISYWSIVDHITARVMAEKKPETSRLAAEAIETLIDYSSMAPSSILLIKYNQARLYFHAGDVELAVRAMRQARSENHQVIEKRIRYDETLKDLVTAYESSEPEK